MSLPIPLLNHGSASPFIEGTMLQYAWDSVSLGVFMSCPRKYQYLILEGWTPRSPNFAIALDFGILFHSGLEFYHKARAIGCEHDLAVAEMIKKLVLETRYSHLPTAIEIEEMKEAHDEDEDDGITLRNSKVRTRYHLLRALVWYLEHYANDPITTHLLRDGSAAVEVSFRVELPISPSFITGQEHPFILSGHLDRVGVLNQSLFVVDYKTTKSLSSQFFAAFSLSHQLSGYTFAGRVALEEPISGVIIDGIALQVGGCKFSRAPSPRSQTQLEEFFANVSEITANAERYAIALADNPKFLYPMNTQSCYFCEFKQVCSQPPEMRRRFLAMSYEQKPAWNPLENR